MVEECATVGVHGQCEGDDGDVEERGKEVTCAWGWGWGATKEIEVFCSYTIGF